MKFIRIFVNMDMRVKMDSVSSILILNKEYQLSS